MDGDLYRKAGDVDHVRRPLLPWRGDDGTSECGLVSPARMISRAEFLDRLNRQGKKRSAMTTCMTCWDTARRWPGWQDDPVRALGREFYGRGGVARNEATLRSELFALAALVEAHRDEFDGYLAGLAETASLDERRRMQRRRTMR